MKKIFFAVTVLGCLAAAALAQTGVKKANGGEVLLSGTLALYVDSPVVWKNGVQEVIDKDNPEVAPISLNGEIMLPLRFVAENFNAEVLWDKETDGVTVSGHGITVEFIGGSKEIFIDGQKKMITIAPEKINGVYFVPLDYLSDVIARDVYYDRGLIVISEQPVNLDEAEIDGLISQLNGLPVIGSKENFINLMKESERDRALGDIVFEAGVVENTGAPAESAAAPSEALAAPEASDTNVQVEGVDEGDLLKNDGEYLYYANSDGVQIIKTAADGSLEKTAEIAYDAQEIYLYGQKLALIGRQKDFGSSDMAVSPSAYYEDKIEVAIYDISDKSSPKLNREFDFSGSYLSSRQINGYLYLLTNRYIYGYGDDEYDDMLPSYSDSANPGQNVIGYDKICYFPQMSGDSFLLSAAIPLEGGEADVKTYLGAGDNIYVSAEHMYVASPGRLTAKETGQEIKQETEVYKFSLGKSITYLTKGTVSGSPLNQFSMDEYNGNFRIATTEYDYTSGQESNNMFILDENMKASGEIRKIAPSEKIYSVRFMGNRAYMVTFKMVDPLFALDLSDPEKPVILGALKIPGYSDYLHPYDENHLIGFGKDTVEQYGMAYYKGMKISFFDVTDVSNPKEKFVEYIGDRGTESELLSNHRALLFSKADGTLAFPVSIAEVKNKTPENELDYGEFTFQGALVYHIDEDEGFRQEGRISHLSADDYLRSGYYYSDGEKYIRRIAYIGDYYYTISDAMLQSHDRQTLAKKGEIALN